MTYTPFKKSTLVRGRLAVTRLGFMTAERLSPALGARAAERLWFRVPATARRNPPDGGQGFEARSHGHIVRGRSWGDGPVVYLVHGWGGQLAHLGALVEPLVERGFRVVGFDAPSHGESDPGAAGAGSTDAAEFGRAFDAVAAVHGPARAVVAHSMGSVVTLLTLKHGWLSTDRLVLVAPMLDIGSLFDGYEQAVGFGPRTRRALERRTERRVGLPVSEFDVLKLATEIERPELLVVHDRDDAETSYQDSVRIVDAWPGARLLGTTGLGHRRLLRHRATVREVVDFVAAPDSSARSA